LNPGYGNGVTHEEPVQMTQLAIVEAFADLPDTRRTAGQRHLVD
jgi:hypothetical protein